MDSAEVQIDFFRPGYLSPESPAFVIPKTPKKHKPLDAPLVRRCNQPFLYVTVSASGEYLLCCQDGLQTTRGKFGSVHSGVEGFKDFWYGKEMQTVRRRLRLKNRADTKDACAKCNITFSRCDFKLWSDGDVARYREGGEWNDLPDDPLVGRFDSNR